MINLTCIVGILSCCVVGWDPITVFTAAPFLFSLVFLVGIPPLYCSTCFVRIPLLWSMLTSSILLFSWLGSHHCIVSLPRGIFLTITADTVFQNVFHGELCSGGNANSLIWLCIVMNLHSFHIGFCLVSC